jgi:hypothetical protein
MSVGYKILIKLATFIKLLAIFRKGADFMLLLHE